MKKIITIAIATLLLLVIVLIFSNKEDDNLLINDESYMNYNITLKTSKGDIQFVTYIKEAPNTVNNFVKLAREGFYDGLTFHRVIDGFMIQGGCPYGTGTGGPGYTFEDEINVDDDIYKEGYKKGVVAMANAGADTQGSQFFIMVDDVALPPSYTIFGKVISGQNVADDISMVDRNQNDMPLEKIIIEEVLITEEN